MTSKIVVVIYWDMVTCRHSKHEKCCSTRIFIDLSQYISHQVTGNNCVSAMLPSEKKKLSSEVFCHRI